MATVTVVPNPVIVGETFKIEGVGFNTEHAALVAVDGELAGRAYAHTSPEGGVIAFLWSFDTLGPHEVQVTQEWPETSVEDEDGTVSKEAGGDLKGKEDVEVIDGWPAPETEPEAETAARKMTAKKQEKTSRDAP